MYALCMQWLVCMLIDMDGSVVCYVRWLQMEDMLCSIIFNACYFQAQYLVDIEALCAGITVIRMVRRKYILSCFG